MKFFKRKRKPYVYSEAEGALNDILFSQEEKLKALADADTSAAEERIEASEALLKELGIALPEKKKTGANTRVHTVEIRSFETILEDARTKDGSRHALEELFTEEELDANTEAVRQINAEYQTVYGFGAGEITIIALSCILAQIAELLLGRYYKKTSSEGGVDFKEWLKNYLMRSFSESSLKEQFESVFQVEWLPPEGFEPILLDPEELALFSERLTNSEKNPMIGFVCGILDLKYEEKKKLVLKGKLLYGEAEAAVEAIPIDSAVAEKIKDLITETLESVLSGKEFELPLSLPLSIADFLNGVQAEHIGETIDAVLAAAAEKKETFLDFVYLDAASIPLYLIDLIICLFYAHCLKDADDTYQGSINRMFDREENPKLYSMLFAARSAFMGIKAGKLYFSKQAAVINPAEWTAFSLYAYEELKWHLTERPMRDTFVQNKIFEELKTLNEAEKEFYQDVIFRENIAFHGEMNP